MRLEHTLSPAVDDHHSRLRKILQPADDPIVVFAVVVGGQGVGDEQAALNGFHRLGGRAPAPQRVGHHHGVGVFGQSHRGGRRLTERVAPIEDERCLSSVHADRGCTVGRTPARHRRGQGGQLHVGDVVDADVEGLGVSAPYLVRHVSRVGHLAEVVQVGHLACSVKHKPIPLAQRDRAAFGENVDRPVAHTCACRVEREDQEAQGVWSFNGEKLGGFARRRIRDRDDVFASTQAQAVCEEGA